MTGGLRIGGADAAARARIRFDGREIEARAGEMLAAALWAAGIRAL
ncbi:MAG: (2Fe-2S)-binding protein, partial [Proteobacteria bacterium]|nr:(2Fe-2S)-binding protein [Pseudomonadota bacterium]